MKKPSKPILEKHTIFITAIGRSATGSLARLLSRVVKDCHGVHEPDVLWFYRTLGLIKDDPQLIQKIKNFGLFHMTIAKFIPLRNLRGLSLAVQRGKIDEAAAAAILYKLRYRYVLGLQESIYAECNPQLARLLDIIPLVFPNSKTVCLMRDGRNWVRSFLNRVPWIFWKRDILSYVPGIRTRADLFPNDPFFQRWKDFSQFQRVCWLWRFRVECAVKAICRNPHAKFIKYEDLFEGPNNQETMEDLLKFLTSFPDGFQAKYKYYKEAIPAKKFGRSHFSYIPIWEEWTPSRIKEFQEICGDSMASLGYGQELLWLEKIDKIKTI